MAENASAAAHDSSGDVLVVFGITGDLARVMTFLSLYRLEQRGLLECPIVGVAVDDWTIDQLIDRARTSIAATGEPLDDAVFERFAARLSYVQGDFADDATYERVGAAISSAKTPVFYLEIPPSLFATVVKGLSNAGLTEHGRVVIEKPFGHDLPSARALAAELHRYVDESQIYQDRSLPRQDGPRGDPLPALREHDARAGLEPQLRRLRADHHGRGLRRRRPRTLLRSGRRPARRRRQPPDAAVRSRRNGGAVARRPRHDQGRADRALPLDRRSGSATVRARPVRRLSRDRRSRR